MSQTQAFFPPIDAVSEKNVITFDFGNLLGEGVTISSATVACTVAADSVQQDASASTRVLSSPQIKNALLQPNGSGAPNAAVSVLVGTMLAGVTYVLQCLATCSDGEVLSLWAHLPCQAPR